ncbi:hypothetical protein ACFPPD_07990 [Cohnella suwonensis]|uniref:Uncharacterized protein n=1 Tax=Cohnella suwonensis TaxID=696072 RepID=A0ABW0LRX8_9BACL
MRRNAEWKRPVASMGAMGAMNGRFARDVMGKYGPNRREAKSGRPLVFRTAKKEDRKATRKLSATDSFRPRAPLSPSARPTPQSPIRISKERVVVERERVIERERIVERIVDREKIVERRVPDTREVQRIIVEQRLLREHAVLGKPPSASRGDESRSGKESAASPGRLLLPDAADAPTAVANPSAAPRQRNSEAKSVRKATATSSPRPPRNVPGQSLDSRERATKDREPHAELAIPDQEFRPEEILQNESAELVTDSKGTDQRSGKGTPGDSARVGEAKKIGGTAESPMPSRHASFAAAISGRTDWPLRAKSFGPRMATSSRTSSSRKANQTSGRTNRKRMGETGQAVSRVNSLLIFLNRKKVSEMIGAAPLARKLSSPLSEEAGNSTPVDPISRRSLTQTSTTKTNLPHELQPEAMLSHDSIARAIAPVNIRNSPASGPARREDNASFGEPRLRETESSAETRFASEHKDLISYSEAEGDQSSPEAKSIGWRLRNLTRGSFDLRQADPTGGKSSLELVLWHLAVSDGQPIIAKRDPSVTAATEHSDTEAGNADVRKLASESSAASKPLEVQNIPLLGKPNPDVSVQENSKLESELKLKSGSLRLSARWIDEAISGNRSVDGPLTHRADPGLNVSAKSAQTPRSGEKKVTGRYAKQPIAGLVPSSTEMKVSPTRMIRHNGIPSRLPVRSAALSAKFAEESALRNGKFVFRRTIASGESPATTSSKTRAGNRSSAQPEPLSLGEHEEARRSQLAMPRGAKVKLLETKAPIVLRRTERATHPVDTTGIVKKSMPVASMSRSPEAPSASFQQEPSANPQETARTNKVYARSMPTRGTKDSATAMTGRLISRMTKLPGNVPVSMAGSSPKMASSPIIRPDVTANTSFVRRGSSFSKVAAPMPVTARSVRGSAASGKQGPSLAAPGNQGSPPGGSMALPGRSVLNRTGIAASAMYDRLGRPPQDTASFAEETNGNGEPSLVPFRSRGSRADERESGTALPVHAAAPADPAIHRRAKPARQAHDDADVAESAALELRRNAPAVAALPAKPAEVPAEPSRIDAEVLKQAVSALPQLQPDQLADQVYKALMKRMKFEQRLRGF